MKQDFTPPIPEPDLLRRFEPPFASLKAGRSATLLALPHTGRTSHLYFLFSQPGWIEKLGLEQKQTNLVLVDASRMIDNYSAFLLEATNRLAEALGQKASCFASRDPYLLTQEFFDLVKEASRRKQLILVVTLNQQSLEFLEEIDHLLVQAQKAAWGKPVQIFWSIDTTILRNYQPGHSTSTLLENIFLFPTFNKQETEYNLERLALLKGKEIASSLIKRGLSLTGGIAGLFHPFVDLVDAGSEFDLEKRLANSPNCQRVLKNLKKELRFSAALYPQLASSSARRLIDQFKPSGVSFQDLKLQDFPTAQEIGIINKMLKQENQPLSRDEIAQTIWGKAWETKYSDWAIDKAISRLRKKMEGGDYRLMTVRNLGYQLTKLS